jgi:hypothetical protein
MRNYIGILFLTVILFSCSESPKPVTKNKEEKAKVSYSMTVDQHLSSFPLLKFPCVIDGNFLKDSSKNHTSFPISIGLVSELASNFGGDDDSQRESYYVNDFIKIQTAKQEGKYDDFVQKLDIGMTKDANCYALGRLEFGDSLGLLIWKVVFTSYEACPYFSGTHVLGSIYQNGKLIKTYQLAMNESGADAPMSFNAKKKVRIDKNGILKMFTSTETLEEEVVIETEKIEKVFVLTSSGIKKN